MIGRLKLAALTGALLGACSPSGTSTTRSTTAVRDYCAEQENAIKLYVAEPASGSMQHRYGSSDARGTWFHFARSLTLCVRAREIPDDESKRFLDAADDALGRIMVNIAGITADEQERTRTAIRDLASLYERATAYPIH